MRLQNLEAYFNEATEVMQDIRPIAPVEGTNPLRSEIERLKAMEVRLENREKALKLKERRVHAMQDNVGKASMEKAAILKQLQEDQVDYKALSFNCMKLISYLSSDKAFINATNRQLGE